ncbi:MAG: hypothetical protein COV45_04215 [Deltaproteobacteria bacterium CG11_big_fil_rev_8_21_14_0_20_47_16]|nr:MAG: hypothetical protein COV45_04215 [Deltaproteobacteria bacterium CG11_big_fil_rev_8_21_14_0_20_47_16]
MAKVSGVFGPSIPLQQAAGTPPAATPSAARSADFNAQTKLVADVRHLAEDADKRFAKDFPQEIDKRVKMGRRYQTIKTSINMTWRAKFTGLMSAIVESERDSSLRLELRTREGRQLLNSLKENPSQRIEDAVATYNLGESQVKAIRDKLSQWLVDQDEKMFKASVGGLLNRIVRGDAIASSELLALLTYRTGNTPQEAFKYWLAAVAAVIPDPAQRTAATMDEQSSKLGEYLYNNEGSTRRHIPVPVDTPVSASTRVAGSTPDEVRELEIKHAMGRVAAIAKLKTASLTIHDVPKSVIDAVDAEETARLQLKKSEQDVAAVGSDAAKKSAAEAALENSKVSYDNKKKATDKAVSDWLKSAQDVLNKAVAELTEANAATGLSLANKQAKINAAQVAVDRASALVVHIQSLSPQATVNTVVAFPMYMAVKVVEQEQAALAAAEKAKSVAVWKEGIDKIVEKDGMAAKFTNKVYAGKATAGDTFDSGLFREKGSLELSVPIKYGEVGIETEMDINSASLKPGQGSSRQDLFGSGMGTKVAGGNLAVDYVSLFARLLDKRLTLKAGLNEIWTDPYGPLLTSLGKTALPAAINSNLGGYGELKLGGTGFINFVTQLAIGRPIASASLTGNNKFEYLTGDDEKPAFQVDGAATLSFGAPIDGGKRKSTLSLTAHVVDTMKDDQSNWDLMLNVAGRAFYKKWQFGFNWRPINNMTHIAPYQSDVSHWALIGQVGYDVSSRLVLSVSASHSTAQTVRELQVVGDGSPATGVPEQSITITDLTDYGIAANFKLNKYNSILARVARISVPEGDGFYYGLIYTLTNKSDDE